MRIICNKCKINYCTKRFCGNAEPFEACDCCNKEWEYRNEDIFLCHDCADIYLGFSHGKLTRAIDGGEIVPKA